MKQISVVGRWPLAVGRWPLAVGLTCAFCAMSARPALASHWEVELSASGSTAIDGSNYDWFPQGDEYDPDYGLLFSTESGARRDPNGSGYLAGNVGVTGKVTVKVKWVLDEGETVLQPAPQSSLRLSAHATAGTMEKSGVATTLEAKVAGKSGTLRTSTNPDGTSADDKSISRKWLVPIPKAQQNSAPI